MVEPVSDVDVLGSAPPRSPRSTRLGDDREFEILQATYSLLSEVGYEGLRFDAVAARAKASKATLYRHWPGKAQLVADAVRVARCRGMTCPTPARSAAILSRSCGSWPRQ